MNNKLESTFADEQQINKRLLEAVGSPECRVSRVLLFLDITDSTSLKETSSETEWLGQIGSFFRIVEDSVEQSGGKIVKYLGDGAMVAFDDREAAEAINCAIRIQHTLSENRKHNIATVSCSVGIAQGRVVFFRTPEEARDYVGSPVDRAARLCKGASPGAIFVDENTVTAAAMHRVSSPVGLALDRESKDYTGERQSIAAKGFKSPIEYYEVHWSLNRFGVKSEAVTEATKKPSRTDSLERRGASEKLSSQLTCGTVTQWHNDKQFGFIVTDDGEFYYADVKHNIDGLSLKPKDKVYFRELPPLVAGKNPVAGVCVAVGSRVTGTFTNAVSDKQFGFVTIRDMNGGEHSLLALPERGIEVSDLYSKAVFGTIGENDKGPVLKHCEQQS